MAQHGKQMRLGAREGSAYDSVRLPPDHPLLDSAPNLGPLIPRWEISKFENC